MSKNNGARGGSIVNISSMASTIGGRNGRTLYATSKGAIDVFTVGAAKELAQDGIRVNAIRPGVIKTDLVSNELDGRPELEKHYTSTIPMKRFGKPQEVSELALWLLSDSSSFVSGARIDVSGGGFII
jgi:NAD(P)-dependent dehydrogenase (short-subunit alcohol dehydrogenase family)